MTYIQIKTESEDLGICNGTETYATEITFRGNWSRSNIKEDILALEKSCAQRNFSVDRLLIAHTELYVEKESDLNTGKEREWRINHELKRCAETYTKNAHSLETDQKTNLKSYCLHR